MGLPTAHGENRASVMWIGPLFTLFRSALTKDRRLANPFFAEHPHGTMIAMLVLEKMAALRKRLDELLVRHG